MNESTAADLPQMVFDIAPICLACGQVMEWNGEYRCFDVDLIEVDEEIYECRNPDCNDEELDEDSIAKSA